jgi:UDP-N-acetylglucosamine 2-epimerase (non-hydrolysing)
MRILSSCSARPNFVKLAAVHHALSKRTDVEHIIVHTGQHYDPLLSDIFFEQLKIPQPNHNLGVRGGGSREEVIAATEAAMRPVLEKEKPNLLLVYGDVNGAVGAARAAQKLGIKIGHVEAGLRSGDPEMPEEHNRIEIDRMADLLFCSEQSGMDHLKAEQSAGKSLLVGNTMIDTLIRMMPTIDEEKVLDFLPENFAVATLHRPSNVDDLEGLLRIVGFLGQVNEITPIVLPMHPRFREVITRRDPERTTLPLLSISFPIDPLGYFPFLRLLKAADFVMTDSGGIQEEAAFLGKRCFTLRRNTERPSTIESGSNILIDPKNVTDREKVLAFAKDPHDIKVRLPAQWDGKAGERIADIVCG